MVRSNPRSPSHNHNQSCSEIIKWKESEINIQKQTWLKNEQMEGAVIEQSAGGEEEQQQQQMEEEPREPLDHSILDILNED